MQGTSRFNPEYPGESEMSPMSRTRKRQASVPWWVQKGYRVVQLPGELLVYHVAWSGFPLRAHVFLDVEPEHVGRLHYVESCVMASIDRDQLLRSKPGSAVPAEDEYLRLNYPVLHSFLVDTTFSDGSARAPASLTVFTQDGVWKVMLKEKSLAACLWVSGPSLFLALAALEAQLNSPCPEWRVDRQAEGMKASRIKRPT